MIWNYKRKILESLIEEDSLIFLMGNKEILRNGDVSYDFRQSSNMLLLTEVSSPDIVLVWHKSEWIIEWVIFSDPITDREKLWWTSRWNENKIRETSGIQEILPLESITSYIDPLLTEIQILYIDNIDDNPFFDGISSFEFERVSLRDTLEPLRMIKSPEEIECMKKAISVTEKAQKLLIQSIQPGMYEYEIEAMVAGVFRAHHMTEAYPTIVASGPNACTLHYTSHDRQIQDGDFVLVDFGAEYHGYAADITRVFGVWSISERQRQVHASVLDIKKYAESLIRPWMQKLEYEKMVRQRTNIELKKLGLMSNTLSSDEEENISRKYFPHSVSHFLGLDVHDSGARDATFRSGMVITCEPGIYIEEEGIWVRLEDDVLITENWSINLSENISLALE